MRRCARAPGSVRGNASGSGAFPWMDSKKAMTSGFADDWPTRALTPALKSSDFVAFGTFSNFSRHGSCEGLESMCTCRTMGGYAADGAHTNQTTQSGCSCTGTTTPTRWPLKRLCLPSVLSGKRNTRRRVVAVKPSPGQSVSSRSANALTTPQSQRTAPHPSVNTSTEAVMVFHSVNG